MLLTFSIVLYKNFNDVDNLLKSLQKTKYESKIIIIDNSPTKEFKKNCELYSNVIYIYNYENVGFGAGHNIAIDYIKKFNSKFHIVLNPDIYFDNDVFPNIIQHFAEDIGIATPKIFYSNNELQYNCRLLPSVKTLIMRRILPKKIAEKFKVKEELRFTGYNKIMEIPFIMGCFMVFDSSLFIKLNGFDKRFFMYLEDADICRRTLELKKKIIFIPNSSVYHRYERGSRKKMKLFFIHFLSMVKYFNKWGWIIDYERNKINKDVLSMFK